MSITSIENLSNELFYELFDYLDGIDIYKAFSNLNYRFQQLLNSSARLFKINITCQYEESYTEIFKQLTLLNHLNKHQIYSFFICIPYQAEHFFSSYSIDSSFDHLESFVLDQIEPTILIQLLSKLTCLPRLFSLTIDMLDHLSKLTDIYQLIFALSKLKYLKFTVYDTDFVNTSLSFFRNSQVSSIEYLIIEHRCDFNDLLTVLSYTPRLRHLNVYPIIDDNDNDSIIENILPIKLSNLTYISLDVHYIKFDKFTMFIKNFNCKLKVLRYRTQSNDVTYLYANRWKELILKYFPQLEKFYFQYEDMPYYVHRSPAYRKVDFNQFISSFWIEKRWVFKSKIDRSAFIFKIYPYKETWYDRNSSIDYSKSSQLTFRYPPKNEYSIDIHGILSVAQFYHLEIKREQIDISTLMDIICRLSELDSLKIHSLSLSSTCDSSMEEINRCFISNKNKITKIYLEKFNKIEEINFLIKFCPRMNYLHIDSINNMDIELFIKEILDKINNDGNQYFYTLCLRIPTEDDKIIEKFKNIINSNKSIVWYSIKCILDVIYLQWKKDYYQYMNKIKTKINY
ncbi:unnamed protein product [Rotaria sp. Silwood1]|nr:unnamed protein product [Rotaria sp. Silwood1]CAF4966670.1 unnamed protein product [Rotaria sp. Silwood1]